MIFENLVAGIVIKWFKLDKNMSDAVCIYYWADCRLCSQPMRSVVGEWRHLPLGGRKTRFSPAYICVQSRTSTHTRFLYMHAVWYLIDYNQCSLFRFARWAMNHDNSEFWVLTKILKTYFSQLYILNKCTTTGLLKIFLHGIFFIYVIFAEIFVWFVDLLIYFPILPLAWGRWKECNIHNAQCNIIVISRAYCRLAPNQWETSLHCNDVSHWLSTSL